MNLKSPFLVSLLGLIVVVPGYAAHRRPVAKPAAKQEQAAETTAPAIPQTLAEMPASAPQVAFQSGELTISAQNSTLGDILKAVKAQTGANIELPGNAPERVVGTFGPGPARDVLTSLLNGSHFNFLLLGSASDPNALDRVILMAKSSSSVESNAPPAEQASTYQPAFNRPIAAPMAAPGTTVTVEGQDAQDDSATDDTADATDDAAEDPATEDQTADDTATDETAGEEQQQTPQGQQGVKTPEQMLQELQQRQQQMQQGGQPGMPPGFPNPGTNPGGSGAPPPQSPHN